MTVDAVTRLNAALEGRYRTERELRAGGMATVSSIRISPSFDSRERRLSWGEASPLLGVDRGRAPILFPPPWESFELRKVAFVTPTLTHASGCPHSATRLPSFTATIFGQIVRSSKDFQSRGERAQQALAEVVN